MNSNISPFFIPKVSQPELGRPESTIGENISEGFVDGLSNTSIGLLNQYSKTKGFGVLINDLNDAEQEFYKNSGVELSPHMTAAEAHAIYEAQQQAAQYNDVAERASTMGDVTRVGASFLGSIPDPVNLIPGGFGLAGKGIMGLMKAAGKAALINTAIEGSIFVPLEANVRAAQQRDYGADDAFVQLAFAAGLGGLFGGAGHALSRASKVNTTVDADGKLVAAENSTADFKIVEPSKDNPVVDRPIISVLGTDGKEVKIDPRTGEILGGEGARFSFDDGAVSRTNAQIKSDLEAHFQEKLTGITSVERVERDTLLSDTLETKVNESSTSVNDKRPTTEPEGVLVTRESEGNELKVKEIPISAFMRETLRKANIFGHGARFNANEIIEGRLVRLTKQQFDWAVDNGSLPSSILHKLEGIKHDPNMSKEALQALGDTVFARLHPDVKKTGGTTQTPTTPANDTGTVSANTSASSNIAAVAARKNDADLAARIHKGQAFYNKASQHEVMDIENGIDNIVSIEDLDKYLEEAKTKNGLKGSESADVKRIMNEATKLRNKKQALKEAAMCLLGI